MHHVHILAFSIYTYKSKMCVSESVSVVLRLRVERGERARGAGLNYQLDR